ncbi:hypothetical protein PMI42_00714 [Bradyrhizobium sp. YR681]|uniref:hypothetical protein n=1 Tax=Bradyrhizobium sp. YR681 TaxID=1144344 RepID=UPI000270E687|nr:hypothetical protein [Bradyrhizobium sp. YR681]EJN15697.1 hypothetical protein PMI42_00714 [Bradyrhizobium sp. YR681]
MKVVMLAYHTPAGGAELRPGDIHEFDDDEGRRQIKIGGARLPTKEDESRIEAAARDKAKADWRAELDASTVDELKAGAERNGIDLKGATKKAEIIATIVAAIDAREAEAAAAQAAQK